MIPDQYIHKRIVKSSETTSIQQAAQLMCDHAIGCILVTDSKDSLIGIVTDRDLACIAVGKKGSANLSVTEVMTPHPLTVEQTEDLEHVINLMQETGIRRIPVVDRIPDGSQKCIGLITLDDLVASKTIDYDQLSRIVRSQIERRHALRKYRAIYHPSQSVKGESRHPSLNRFYLKIEEKTGLKEDQLNEVTQAILAALVQRLHYSGAAHFISVLPEGLQSSLLALPSGPNQQITAEVLKDDLSSRFNFSFNKVESILIHFFQGLSELIPNSEMDDLRSSLPGDFTHLLPKSDTPQPKKNEAA
jgi:CBS domain-containing protein/uncharacterized protein (DUF2267 family)